MWRYIEKTLIVSWIEVYLETFIFNDYVLIIIDKKYKFALLWEISDYVIFNVELKFIDYVIWLK